MDCTAQYRTDLAPGGNVNDDHLTKYIAASAPAHAIDGWSFLGRAVASALRGDAYSAIHFGYYAELRAAMSLLASEGIGVFDNRHPVIRPDGTIVNLPKLERAGPGAAQTQWGTTHKVTWPLLKHWSSLQRSANLLSQIVEPNGISLSQWLSAVGSTVPTRALGRKWLSTWGLDLSAFEDDRNSRNLASYRPSEFRRTIAAPVPDTVEFVEQLWRLFEPSPNARFPTLERFLLRRAIRASHPNDLSANALTKLGFSVAEAGQWIAFLAETDDPRPLNLAEGESEIEEPGCQLEVISRAALLLYVATGSTRALLRTGLYSNDILSFWWHRHGLSHGLWQGAPPGDPFDIWADVALTLDDATSWRGGATANVSLHECRRGVPICIDQFGAFDLVAIWGLLP